MLHFYHGHHISVHRHSHNDGLTALRHTLDKRTVLDPPTHTLVRLAELVLTLNAFSFHNLFYQQVSGVAMGTRMGPRYANVFVGWVEERFFPSYTGYVPDLYKRYMDDCVGAATCSNDQLEFFLHHFTNFHPSLKYTVNISSTTLPFLDINFSINYPRLSTSVYYKPTDSHSYFLYSSFHPNHTKNSLLFSQFLGRRQLCSDDIDFKNQALEMYSFFINRGYPSSVLDRALARAKNTSRTINPIRNSRRNNRIPLVLPYHPNTLPIPRTINQNFSILRYDPSIRALFSDRPIISFRRPPNLRNLLVHSSLDRPQQPSTPGTLQQSSLYHLQVHIHHSLKVPQDNSGSPRQHLVPPATLFTVSLAVNAQPSTLEKQEGDSETASENTSGL
ncbi:uncharacterized protein [Lepisosteus oculatus]|uniref:uncharacterized protein n=1 Tax=Lepisosteus oculatus TaxID=7918 RepID=UPI0037149CE5